jgi:hypothetical protein
LGAGAGCLLLVLTGLLLLVFIWERPGEKLENRRPEATRAAHIARLSLCDEFI